MVGTLGYLLVISTFVGCIVSIWAFYRAAQDPETSGAMRIGRGAWIAGTVFAIATFGLLMALVITHQFEFAYVFDNSSRELPLHFLVSATWAGQEGSFLIWIVLNFLVGLAVLRWSRDYAAPVMFVIALCQAFLVSMIVGIKLGPLGIGSSPFITLAEKFPDAPMLQAGLVPQDGSGLNDLLQNYWMVIHPPTLFMGFALMIVPFGYAVTALWKRRYTSWVRPALPWTLAAVLVLGIGIAMGGYWAYVTLSFGGYWAWDPVENSSLVPWLIGITAVHTMIIQKRSGHSHKASLLLSILAYMFVVYSTFLTRSGILGDISVHSFVDLGLYNQLLLWILTMGGLGFGLFIYRYRELPVPDEQPSIWSREFMIFCGAMLLFATAAVVIMGTSAPILGRIVSDNPSTVPIAFYNKWATPLAIGFVFLCGLGQLLWWNKMDVTRLNKSVARPVLLAVAATICVLIFTPFIERTSPTVVAAAKQAANELPILQSGFLDGLTTSMQLYGAGLLLVLLVFVTFFAFFGNGMVLLRIARGNPKLAGGALSHVGFAILVLGIIASSGFSKPVAQPADVAAGRANFVLERGQTARVGDYVVSYTDRDTTSRGRQRYILSVTDAKTGEASIVKPVVYQSNKSQWIQHPDIKLGLTKDLFVAVTPSKMLDSGDGGTGEIAMALGDTVVVGDNNYEITFLQFEMQDDSEFHTETTEIAVAAVLNITNLENGEVREFKPLFLVDGSGETRSVRNELAEWNFAVSFVGMNVNTGQVRLTLEGVTLAPEDWIIVQAIEKPFIFLVWLGILMLSAGFAVSMFRRISDQRLAIQRGLA
jgi:cytochrome c-type biogenesis protein CcmF